MVTASEFHVAGPRGFAGAAGYLSPVIDRLLCKTDYHRVLDIGCGNGYWAGEFVKKGCEVVGIDPSESGIRLARQNYPLG